jgi:phage tail protein X
MADVQHTTIEGQRWDMIATDFYGRADMMNKIIEANPDVTIYDVFPSGIVLNIPIINEVEVLTDAEKLPPWKR